MGDPHSSTVPGQAAQRPSTGMVHQSRNGALKIAGRALRERSSPLNRDGTVPSQRHRPDDTPGFILRLLRGASPGRARPITAQDTSVTWPVIRLYQCLAIRYVMSKMPQLFLCWVRCSYGYESSLWMPRVWEDLWESVRICTIYEKVLCFAFCDIKLFLCWY